jgi:phosphoribosyl-ATP pyrophosphohydrolase/phosphoribosyl-AMP cyclohydrolase
MKIETTADLERIDFARGNGLVPVITQHARTGEVLMLAWSNREALERSLRERTMWYWSRSRQQLWHKGETSGNSQQLVALFLDCDADTILAHVDPAGPSCHTGDWSCFAGPPLLASLQETITRRARLDAATSSYTRKLLNNENLRLKKLGEEAVELALACGAGDADQVAEEAGDLFYHMLVACNAAGVTLDRVLGALERRRSAARPADQQAVEQQQHDRT